MCLIFSISRGQGSKSWKVNVDGTVKDEDSKNPIESAKVELYKDTTFIKLIYTSEKGKYAFFLDPDMTYTVKVSMNGYASKLITINTRNVPDDTDVNGSFKVKMQVSLYNLIPGVDFSLLNKPIGSIFYDKDEKNFDYSVDKEMSFKLEQLQANYEKSKKEKAVEVKKPKEKEPAQEKPKEKVKEEKKVAKEEKPVITDAEYEKRKRDIEEREAKQKEAFLKDKEERHKAEKEAFEIQQAKLRAELAEKHERFKKQRDNQLLDARERALKRKKMIENVISSRKETETVPIQNVRIENVEGTNFKEKLIYVTLMGETIEYKKMAYGWGGTYYKRDGMDITDITFNQELKVYGVDQNK